MSFKVGDFVRANKFVFEIVDIDNKYDEENELCLYTGEWDNRYDEPMYYYADECEKWQPKEGEFIVEQIGHNEFRVSQYGSDRYYSDLIEPFIGTLPRCSKED